MAKLKFISLEELLEKMANEEKFKLVDVLPQDAYKEGHIPGAINLPLAQLSELAAKNLKKTDTVIVYCGSYSCHASTNAAKLLQNLGYKNVLDFKGGKRLWTQEGLELEK